MPTFSTAWALLVGLAVAASPALLGSRRGRAPGWVAWAVRLGLLALVAWVYRELFDGKVPTQWDHNFHLLRITEAEALLRRGSVLGWSDAQFAGSPPLLLYPPISALLPALLRLATGCALGTAHIAWLLLCLAAMPLACHQVARHHFGELAGAMAGIAALFDPGDWWVGGHGAVMEIGMAVQTLSAALSVWALQDPVGDLTSERPSRWAGLGLKHGLATLCHPSALAAALAFTPALLLADGRLRAAPWRRTALAAATAGLGMLAVAAWWLVPFLAHSSELLHPSVPMWTVADRSDALAKGMLFGQPLLLGTTLVGLARLAGDRSGWGRGLAATLALACLWTLDVPFGWLGGLERHGSLAPWGERLLTQRLFAVARPLSFIAAAAALAPALLRALRRPSLPGRLAWAALGAGVAVWLSDPAVKLPGWPANPVPGGMHGPDLESYRALVAKAVAELRPGERLYLGSESDLDHDTIGPAALAGATRVFKLGYEAATGLRGRFWSTDAQLLGRLGGGPILIRGNAPRAGLPLLRREGSFSIGRLAPQPRAWIRHGPGRVEILDWSDDHFRLLVSGAGQGSELVLAVDWFSAWRRFGAGPALRPVGPEAEVVAREGVWFIGLDAVDGEVEIGWRTPTSVWVGGLLSLLATGLLVWRVVRRTAPPSPAAAA